MPYVGPVSRHGGQATGQVRRKAGPTHGFRIPPLRGCNMFGSITQGAALGYRVPPLRGCNMFGSITQGVALGCRIPPLRGYDMSGFLIFACRPFRAYSWLIHARAPTGPNMAAQGSALGTGETK